MSIDTKYLKQHPDGTWRVQVAVPSALRKKLGKVLIEKSLRTTKKAEAIRRRDEVMPIILAGFESARAGKLRDPDFSAVNMLIEFDVAPHKMTFDDVVKLVKGNGTELAEIVAKKIIERKKFEPDEIVSVGGELKFFCRGKRVAQDANGLWKPLRKVSRDTMK